MEKEDDWAGFEGRDKDLESSDVEEILVEAISSYFESLNSGQIPEINFLINRFPEISAILANLLKLGSSTCQEPPSSGPSQSAWQKFRASIFIVPVE